MDVRIFRNFSHGLLIRTVNRETDTDPSGLCWRPSSASEVRSVGASRFPESGSMQAAFVRLILVVLALRADIAYRARVVLFGLEEVKTTKPPLA